MEFEKALLSFSKCIAVLSFSTHRNAENKGKIAGMRVPTL